VSRKSTALDPDLALLRQEILRRVADHALSMVQCAIDAVEQEGQYQAMKFLFEMVGLYPPEPGTQNDTQDSLAEILLARLGMEPRSGQNDPGQ
jgi:hypothetical protein